uniref:Uncharacterized protein n=1 Tax=Globisporangium ultimum (strain ATCC 200006 / CBS 805.95 / DAOM BR144) TaxID=431595 RepID=K3XB87_GLOUD
MMPAPGDGTDTFSPIVTPELPAASRRRSSSKYAGGAKRGAPSSNRPENSRWAQQKLPMWEPMLTLTWSIGICLVIAASCLVLGVAVVTKSSSLTTIRVVYDDGSDTNLADHGHAKAQQDHGTVTKLDNCLLDTLNMANSFHADHTCFINITLTEPFTGTAHVYYELTGYHQHHRRFVSSMDRTQFTDEWRPDMAITMCAPLEKLESPLCDVGTCDPATTKVRKAFPCGIVANTMFNDIFWLHEGVLPNGDKLTRTDLVSKGAARTYMSHNSKNPTWPLHTSDYLPVWNNPNFSRIIPPPPSIPGAGSPVDHMPYITSDYTNSTAWVHDPLDPDFGVGTGVENEHWRVWVEGAANQPFRKAYGNIERALPAGTMLVFAVQSNFFVRSFGGSKALVVSEVAWFGSENVALGVFYLAVGGIFLVAGLLFAVRKITRPRPLGDATYLSWKHKAKAKAH